MKFKSFTFQLSAEQLAATETPEFQEAARACGPLPVCESKTGRRLYLRTRPKKAILLE